MTVTRELPLTADELFNSSAAESILTMAKYITAHEAAEPDSAPVVRKVERHLPAGLITVQYIEPGRPATWLPMLSVGGYGYHRAGVAVDGDEYGVVVAQNPVTGYHGPNNGGLAILLHGDPSSWASAELADQEQGFELARHLSHILAESD